MTDDELRDAVKIMRQRATRAGQNADTWSDALWDLIVDCEMLLKGVETSVPRKEIEQAVEQALTVK
jgi:hypothetical protein